MATVTLKKVKKNYGHVEVMDNIDLSIEHQKFVVLLGSSGCGKTTLLRMIAGLETITGGEIFIDDLCINHIHPRDRNIAMVFQNYALYPTMKVFDNIGFSLQVAKRPKHEIEQKVKEVADILHISEYLDRYPKELSGGQRQRVAMGRTMVRNAKVFLFDEPLSNLDAKLRLRMRVEIRQLHDRLKATTIYVTHDQVEAMTMADEIVLMRGGKIVQIGTPDDFYDTPNCIYVADFIGVPPMNFVEGFIQKQNGSYAFVAKGIDIPLAIPVSNFLDRPVICGIRPSDLKIAEQGHICGQMKLKEMTGSEIQIHFEIEGQDLVATAPRKTELRQNSICFEVDPQKLHFFDQQTEQRLN